MHRVAVACTVAASLALATLPSRAGAAPPPVYRPPVEAEVADPFRPPAHRYGPGNRGLEYGTAPGTPVRAAAGGLVTFAGLVAGSRHVTVRHPDGLRTTYSFLASINVVVGQRVEQGTEVGATAGHLHFGVRSGDSYLDPASLFSRVAVRLVPFDDPPGTGPAGERSAIRQLIGGVGGVVNDAADRVVAGAAATSAWLRDEGGQTLRTALHYAAAVGPGAVPLRLLTSGVRSVRAAEAASRRPCTASGLAPPAPPGDRRVAVLVAGLGSSSRSAAIDDLDTAALGYADPDVVRFSYGGGRTPTSGSGLERVAASDYGPADTQTDLRASGSRLAELIEALAHEMPDTPIDVFAHSQGGLVTRLALRDLQGRHGADWLRRVGLVVTLGTPHDGADLATAVFAVGSTQLGSLLFDQVAGPLGLELDDDAVGVGQLAETSQLISDLAKEPLPQSIRAVSIAARGDPIVPVPRTELAGATQVVVPIVGLHAHDALPGSPEAARELALAVAGLPPTCTTFQAALADQLIGEGISWAEDTAGAVAWAATARLGAPIGG